MDSSSGGTQQSDSVKYGHVFIENGRQYLFLGRVGSGSQSQAQLVCEMQDARETFLAVRKILHRRITPQAAPHVGEDPDAEMARYIQDTAADRRQGPKICKLLHAGDIEDKSLTLTRTSYWKLCNGGSLEAMANKLKRDEYAHLTFPRALIIRCVHHVLQSLQFLQSLPRPIVFADMFVGNWLMHFSGQNWLPDFYLADFGRSYYIDNNSGAEDYIRDLELLCSEVQETFPAPVAPRNSSATVPDPLMELCSAIEAVTSAFERNPKEEFPDLAELIRISGDFAVQGMMDLRRWQTRHATTIKSMTKFDAIGKMAEAPQLYDTQEEARDANIVHGPWYMASIQVMPTLQLVDVDLSTTHHRPNADNNKSETDSNVGAQSQGSGSNRSSTSSRDPDETLATEVSSGLSGQESKPEAGVLKNEP